MTPILQEAQTGTGWGSPGNSPKGVDGAGVVIGPQASAGDEFLELDEREQSPCDPPRQTSSLPDPCPLPCESEGYRQTPCV